MRSIYLQSFLLIPLVVSEYALDKLQSVKNEQRAITQKLGKAELFFCTSPVLAFLLNIMYQPTKFIVHTSYSIRVISGTRKADGRTHGQTD
jgi:hypothetical protein